MATPPTRVPQVENRAQVFSHLEYDENGEWKEHPRRGLKKTGWRGKREILPPEEDYLSDYGCAESALSVKTVLATWAVRKAG